MFFNRGFYFLFDFDMYLDVGFIFTFTFTFVSTFSPVFGSKGWFYNFFTCSDNCLEIFLLTDLYFYFYFYFWGWAINSKIYFEEFEDLLLFNYSSSSKSLW
jgi:hypothetical protein